MKTIPKHQRSCTSYFSCIFVFILILTVTFFMVAFCFSWYTSSSSPISEAIISDPWNKDSKFSVQCFSDSDKLTEGRWVERAYSKQEFDEVEKFTNRARARFSIPQNLQRSDNKCGSQSKQSVPGFGGFVSATGLEPSSKTTIGYYPSINELIYRLQRCKRTVEEDSNKTGEVTFLKVRPPFRALCDPKGSLPCCYENKCVARSEESCRCKNCFDMRQRIHAELAKWVPTDPKYKVHTFNKKEACKLLHNMTIYFFGDSFMRHIYTSFLNVLKESNTKEMLKVNIPEERKKECMDKYMMYATVCKSEMRNPCVECDGNVIVKLITTWRTRHASIILNETKTLMGVPNSLVVFSLGGHESYNFDLISSKIFKPLFKLLSNNKWPKLIWSGSHFPGLLKSPTYHQQKTDVQVYATKVKALMRQQNIPMLDFRNLTDETISFDGTHFGKAVNDMKVSILLHSIQSLRTNHDECSLYHEI